jgi:AraC-like DNA-binding protein
LADLELNLPVEAVEEPLARTEGHRRRRDDQLVEPAGGQRLPDEGRAAADGDVSLPGRRDHLVECGVEVGLHQDRPGWDPGVIGRRSLRAASPILGGVRMSATEDANRRLLRARDAIDRHFAEPLDVPALARVALMSPAHFIREFKAAFGEPPHRYLQRRRVERAMALLRGSTQGVTEVGLAVGFTSPGTFSRTFRAVVGQSPSTYRRGSRPLPAPDCVVRAWTRPVTLAAVAAGSSSFGEAAVATGP